MDEEQKLGYVGFGLEPGPGYAATHSGFSPWAGEFDEAWMN